MTISKKWAKVAKRLRKKAEEKWASLEDKVRALEVANAKLQDDKEESLKELIEMENAL